ncbi:CBS domain-containing protein [Salipiger sp.]|uniref:CBS domain-containing protein n=1 Tax=Salipiger sp. TaxID=2078585 RepID=UPI003A97BA78
MQVKQILKDKPEGGVITIRPGTTVAELTKLLAEKRIGGVVVSSDGRTALGIISERDVVRQLGQVGAESLSRPVEEYMTQKVEVCSSDDDTNEVLARMTRGRFRHMPVVDDGEMTGIVTIGDVVKAQISELAMEKDALQGMIMGF